MPAETFYENQVLPPKDPNSGLPTLIRQGGKWVPMSGGAGGAAGAAPLAPDAPGATYLKGVPVRGKDPSEAAYFRDVRKAQDPSVAAAERTSAQDREFEGLLTRRPTGGRYAVPVVGNMFGLFDTDVQRMRSLSSAAARSQRQPGEGTISDFDARMFQQQVEGVKQSTGANRMIIQAQRLGAENAQQRRQMMDWYHQRFNTTEGFDEAWSRYRDDNPIFDPASQSAGQPRLNASRQNWRQYFGDVRGAGDARPSQTVQDIQRSQRATLPSAAVEGYRKLYAAGGIDPSAKFGSPRNPFQARDMDTLNRLPKGSYAISPDGVLGIIR